MDSNLQQRPPRIEPNLSGPGMDDLELSVAGRTVPMSAPPATPAASPTTGPGGAMPPTVATQVFGHFADGPNPTGGTPATTAAPTTAAPTTAAPMTAAPTTAAPTTAAPTATTGGTTAPDTAAPAPKPTVADYGSKLDAQLDGEIQGNRKTRAVLDGQRKTDPGKVADTEHQLDGNREHLLEELHQRGEVFDGEIGDITAKLGGKTPKNPTPEQKALLDRLATLVKNKEKYRDQTTTLERWHDRREINSINDQLKDPKLDPKAKAQLVARKKQLATGLLSTTKHYEQFDPKWGDTVYGKDKSYTSMRAAGCGPTGLADLLDFADQEDPEGKHAAGDHDPYDPRKVANYATNHGRVKGSGTDGSQMMRDLPIGFPGFAGQDLGTRQGATESLQNGVPVLFLGHNITGQGADGKKIKPYGGHFMVLDGVSDDGQNFKVEDGGRNQTRNMHNIKASQLDGHTEGYWNVK